MPGKRAPQVFFAGESAASRDVLDSIVCLLERTPCGIDANAFNRSCGTAFACISVAAGEISGAHSCAVGEMFNPKVVFNCTQAASSLAALRAAGAANLQDKVVVDVANVLPPEGPGSESLGEQIQHGFPRAKSSRRSTRSIAS